MTGRTEPERLVAELALLHEQVMDAGKRFVDGDPAGAAGELDDVVIVARDIAADLRRLATEVS